MKTSEKLNVLREIAENLEYSIGRDYPTAVEWAENTKYRFDVDAFENFKDSDENLRYHNEILDEYAHYKMIRDYKQSVIDTLFQRLDKLI